MDTSPGFTLASRLRAGETIYSAWCGLGAPIVAELIAREGFGAVAFDQQHGLYDMATTAAGIASARLTGAAPVVRIPLGDFSVASRVLDFGAEAVIAPMINTPADARALVMATKYPPIGERSWGPHRATTLGGIDDQKVYLRDANDLTIVFAMIETRTALTNLDAIVAEPGIDGVFVGPSDLSIALSNGAVLDPVSAEVEREVDTILAAAKKANKIAGAYCATAERALELKRRGFRFLAIGSDVGFLRVGTTAVTKALKSKT
jgi:4-hydroxy-2-oxoheptanedioate aldolase